MKNYRPDIDGLRAVAVVPVVLFHGGVSGFSGGYVGVDVFFVISGFLITSIIYREIKENSFTLLGFYERRIRRLLPALSVVLLFCSVISVLILLPSELESYGRSLIAALLFFSNLYFWRTESYFEPEAETQPLLHTWSLAVEEQFYLFFPIFLIFLSRFMRNHLMISIIIVFILSIILAVFIQEHSTTAGFYLPVPRAWELLLGSLVSLGILATPRSTHWRNILSGLGLLAIFLSIILYSPETNFPGLAAVPPTLGAALIIATGGGVQATFVERALSQRHVVYIGHLSYSLYLWHWPLFVFSRIYLDRDLLLQEAAFICILSFLLSAISLHFVEKPFRERRFLGDRKLVFSGAAFASMLFMLFGVAMASTQGLPQRLPAETKSLVAVIEERHAFSDKYACAETRLIEHLRYGPCRIGSSDTSSAPILVWGDSHAMALKPMFHKVLEQNGRSGFLISIPGCSPLRNVDRIDYGLPCAEFSERVLGYASEVGANRAILVGAWKGIFEAKNTRFEGSVSRDDATRATNVAGGLERAIRALEDVGAKVAFLMPTPGALGQGPDSIIRARMLNLERNINPDRAAYQKRVELLKEILDDVPSQPVRVVNLGPHLCVDVCPVVRDGKSLYFDVGHPSLYLNEMLIPIVSKELEGFL